MRMVQVTIVYDMDDMDKPLADELWDWLVGQVTVQDVVIAEGSEAVSIKELS